MKRLSPRETDELLLKLDFEPILKQRVRRVNWLFNNSNRRTLVYEEKLVRIMLHRQKERIIELENQLSEMWKCFGEFCEAINKQKPNQK